MDSQEEQDIDSSQELRLDSDDIDNENTQCPFADELLRSRQASSSEASQMDAPPESSQRDERQQKRQTKQKSARYAIKEAQININDWKPNAKKRGMGKENCQVCGCHKPTFVCG